MGPPGPVGGHLGPFGALGPRRGGFLGRFGRFLDVFWDVLGLSKNVPAFFVPCWAAPKDFVNSLDTFGSHVGPGQALFATILSHLRRSLEASWRPLEGILVHLGGLLGHLKGVLAYVN